MTTLTAQVQTVTCDLGPVPFEARLHEDDAWSTAEQIALALECSTDNARKHVRAILVENECDGSTREEFSCVAKDGKARQITHYSTDMLLSVAMRVKGKKAVVVRKWIKRVLSGQQTVVAPQLSQAEMALIQMQTAVNAEKIAVANSQRVGALESKVALLETSLPEIADAFTLRGYLRVINYTIAGTVEFRRSVRAMAGKALKKVAKEDCVALPSPVESPRDGFHLLYPRALLEAYAVTLVQDAENRKRSLSLSRARKAQADARARVNELEANDQACR